jgi:hypothetical protein
MVLGHNCRGCLIYSSAVERQGPVKGTLQDKCSCLEGG